ncbi:MAG TPA: glycosyl hydrolase, partial [Actinopolymorphaceae bacterium]
MAQQHPRSLSRRAALIGGLTAATGIATTIGPTGLGTTSASASSALSASPADARAYARRARQTYAALQRYFHDPETSLYLEEYPRTGGNPWSYVWPFSQAMIGTQVMAGIPGLGKQYVDDVADRYEALELYWN